MLRQRLGAPARTLDSLLHAGVNRSARRVVYGLDGGSAHHTFGTTFGGWRLRRAACDLLGHPVGLALVAVVGRAKHEFRLNDRHRRGALDHPLHVAVAVAPLELEWGAAGALKPAAASLGERGGLRAWIAVRA